MLRRDPAEDEGGRDARPRAGIGLAHHRSGRIARRIETRDDRPVLAQRAGIFVGQYAAEGAEIAGKDLDRIEGGCLDRPQRRARLVGAVGIAEVVGLVAAGSEAQTYALKSQMRPSY